MEFEKEFDDRIKEALRKDFKKLYVKEFITSWEEERIVRNIEIGVMDVEHLKKLLSQSIEEERKRIEGIIEKSKERIYRNDDGDILLDVETILDDILSELKKGIV